MQPTNPYAASKAAAEFIVMSYWECFKVVYTILGKYYHNSGLSMFCFCISDYDNML